MATTATLLVASFHTQAQLLHFTTETGQLTLETLQRPASFEGYTWISAHPKHKDIFYGAQRFDGKPGILSVLKLVRGTSAFELEILQSVSSHGRDPCHLGISADATQVALANYDSSTVTTYHLRADGSIDGAKDAVTRDLSQEAFNTGPDAERQQAPHPHGCFYAPTLGDFLVPDLGSDKVRLASKNQHLSCSPGSGPRHAVVHPNGRVAYVINELNNTLTLHDLTALDKPAFATHSVLPSDALRDGKGLNAASLVATSDFRVLYATNRLEENPRGETVVWFNVSEDGKGVERRGEVRTGLDHLRAGEMFEFQGGRYYITGSRTGKGAVVFKSDLQTGDLVEVARNDEVIMPTGFVPVKL